MPGTARIYPWVADPTHTGCDWRTSCVASPNFFWGGQNVLLEASGSIFVWEAAF